MAMFAPIPMPTGGNEAFKDVMDYYEKLQERKMKQPLVSAQTQEAMANASKAKMMANLINMAFGGGGSSGGQGNDMSGGTQGAGENNGYAYDAQGNNIKASPEEIARIAQGGQQDQGMPNMSTGTSMQQPRAGGQQQKALEMLQSLGIVKETPSQQESREKRTAYQKELGSSDVKTLDKWNDIITSNSQITPVLENIRDISANPSFQEMYKNPEYFGMDLAYLKRFGTKDQQDLLTSLGTNAKSIFQAMGQEFKGAFREFELNLFNKATPDETKDTLQQIISKTNTMLSLRNLMTKRMSLANNIVRSSAGQISPANALEIADKQINAKSVREQIQNDFNKAQAEAKHAQEKRVEKSSGNQNANEAEVEIYSPTDQLVARGSKDNAAKFLSKHKGYYQKVLPHGK